MRIKHELDRGVICEKCLHVVTKGNYKRINTFEPVIGDTTGLYKSIDRLNLCNSCYEKYKILVGDYLSSHKNLDQK